MKKQDIRSFLNEFGTKVSFDEDSDYVELIMDNHICIKWYGVEWYIPDGHIMYDSLDNKIFDHLKEKYHL